MFLKYLKIESDDGEIRTIQFQKGLNLIIDESNKENPTNTGNNIGKTTVSRLIDYCLGSKGDDIAKDKEFKNQKSEIEPILERKKFLITLALTDNLDKEKPDIIIKRNFLKNKDKIQTLNEETLNDDDFKNKLQQLIFKTDVQKPSFRQIISKNIRNSTNRLENIVHTLDGVSKLVDYEYLFYFWLGIDIPNPDKRLKLKEEEKKTKAYQKELRKEGEISFFEQDLGRIKLEISKLETAKSNYHYNDNLEIQIQEYSKMKENISQLLTEFSALMMRKSLLEESKQVLEEDRHNINTKQIEFLYKKASKLIPNLQKSFEDTCKFHNDLIHEKIKYIMEELNPLSQQIKDIESEIDIKRNKEKELSEIIYSSSDNLKYEQILLDLNKLYEEKGKREQQEEYWNKTETNLKEIQEDLKKEEESLYSKDMDIKREERLKSFNKYFSDISYELYQERYLLNTKKRNDKLIDLEVTNVKSNAGTGKKKVQIAAFDLAYICFAEENKINCPHFIIHDQIENIDDNQLTTILVDLVESIPCQFIVPILKDKIPEGLDIKDKIILTLSENNKLFKI